MSGSACHQAAVALRQAILEKAEQILGGEAAIADGVVRLVDGGGGDMPLADLAPLRAEGSFESTGTAFTYGACAARVEVDAETGSIRLLQLAVAVDAGFAINPEVVRGQLLGAAAHGIGGALFEQLDYGEDGEPQTGGLRDYHVPLAADLPDVKAVVLELVPSTRNPLGVRGVGEIATAGAAAAIANAVADAVAGRRIAVTALPILPEHLILLSVRGHTGTAVRVDR